MNKIYDDLVRAHGYLHDKGNHRFIKTDAKVLEMLSLERVSIDENKKQHITKADIFYAPVGFRAADLDGWQLRNVRLFGSHTCPSVTKAATKDELCGNQCPPYVFLGAVISRFY